MNERLLIEAAKSALSHGIRIEVQPYGFSIVKKWTRAEGPHPRIPMVLSKIVSFTDVDLVKYINPLQLAVDDVAREYEAHVARRS